MMLLPFASLALAITISPIMTTIAIVLGCVLAFVLAHGEDDGAPIGASYMMGSARVAPRDAIASIVGNQTMARIEASRRRDASIAMMDRIDDLQGRLASMPHARRRAWLRVLRQCRGIEDMIETASRPLRCQRTGRIVAGAIFMPPRDARGRFLKR